MVDFVFLGLDLAGAVFSLLSLGAYLNISSSVPVTDTSLTAVQHTFDILGGVSYLGVSVQSSPQQLTSMSNKL